MSKPTVDLVIASYKEPLDWLPFIPADWRVFIYNSCETPRDFPETAIPICKLPNGGREANGWLHHMATHHGDFADVTFFVQGKPFEHEAQKLIRHFLYGEFDHPLCYVNGRPPVTGGMAIRPHGDVEAYLKRGWGDERIPNPITFSCGAQHYVKREVLMARPAEHYARIRENCFDPTIHSFGHRMEPIWGCVYDWEPFCKK